jgi:UDP-glucuronate 4-epimerase
LFAKQRRGEAISRFARAVRRKLENNYMANYLVTGAAGFIASKVCEFLLADGHTVVGIDNLNSYYDVRLKDYRLGRLLQELPPPLLGNASDQSTYAVGKRWTGGRFLFERVDIENRPELDRLFAEFKFEAVFNLAARAGVRSSMSNPHDYLATNAAGTLNLLECQRQFGVKKLVLASTSSLYAGCPMPFKEDSPVNTPLSPYAASKKAAEVMAYSYHHLYGLDVSILRYFTVFGPAGRPDMSIFRFIKWIGEGSKVEVTGDGSQSRDFTYVDDVARGTILALRPLGYEIINIGGGRNPVSLQQVIATIEKQLGKRAMIVKQPFHIADITASWADIGKAARHLGWSPQTSLDEGLELCVEWYLANRNWLRLIRVQS